MNNTRLRSADVVIEPVDLPVSVDSAIVSFGRATAPAILASHLHSESYGRFSIFACDPADVFCLRRRQSGCPFRAFHDHVTSYPRISVPAAGLPFVGGWIGFITYEAGLSIEHIPSKTQPEPALPLLRFCLYDSAAVFDHLAGQWYLLAVDWPAPIARTRPPVKRRITAIHNQLAGAAAV
jgi:anthranilate/para-aminobenzoate synthase component I